MELVTENPSIPDIDTLRDSMGLIGYKVRFKKNGIYYLLRRSVSDYDIPRVCVWKDFVANNYQLLGIKNYTYIMNKFYEIKRKGL